MALNDSCILAQPKLVGAKGGKGRMHNGGNPTLLLWEIHYCYCEKFDAVKGERMYDGGKVLGIVMGGHQWSNTVEGVKWIWKEWKWLAKWFRKSEIDWRNGLERVNLLGKREWITTSRIWVYLDLIGFFGI